MGCENQDPLTSWQVECEGLGIISGIQILFASGFVAVWEEDWVRQSPSKEGSLCKQAREELVANLAAWPLGIWDCFWLKNEYSVFLESFLVSYNKSSPF